MNMDRQDLGEYLPQRTQRKNPIRGFSKQLGFLNFTNAAFG